MWHTVSIYPCFLFLGLLLIVFTIQSLSELQNLPLFFLELLLASAFAAAAGHPFACLIAGCCRTRHRRPFYLFFPPLLYGALQSVKKEHSFPQILFFFLVLLLLSLAFLGAETLVRRYFFARQQIAATVRITALNELYTKKLNQELIIKHYLAEKNARLEERENISRNIHNSVGHSITAAIMTLEAADLLFELSPDRAREKMNLATGRIRDSLASIRHAVRVLDNETVLVSVPDFKQQLLDVINRFMMDTTRQVLTDFSNVQPEPSLPHEHTEFLTGALEELLSNGVRHGNADRFMVYMTTDSGHINLKVTDNGYSDFSKENSPERIAQGFGLKKLLSYVKRCGGTAVFTNQQGFQAELTLPLLTDTGNLSNTC